jgi:hypothetical protein
MSRKTKRVIGKVASWVLASICASFVAAFWFLLAVTYSFGYVGAATVAILGVFGLIVISLEWGEHPYG